MIANLGSGGGYFPPDDMDRYLPFLTVLISRLIPGGWFYQNEITTARMYQPLLPGTNETILVDSMRRAGNASNAESEHPSPYNMIALMVRCNLASISKRFVFAQSSLDLARTACALERYRLAHGGYPETLDVLAPQFIGQLPLDIINGQPLHYRRTDDGQFVLYSIGWNEKDDGGIVKLHEPPSVAVDLDAGDWVWRYPAK